MDHGTDATRYKRKMGRVPTSSSLAFQQIRNNWDQLRFTGTLPKSLRSKTTRRQTVRDHPGQHPGWDYESPALTAELRALMWLTSTMPSP